MSHVVISVIVVIVIGVTAVIITIVIIRVTAVIIVIVIVSIDVVIVICIIGIIATIVIGNLYRRYRYRQHNYLFIIAVGQFGSDDHAVAAQTSPTQH